MPWEHGLRSGALGRPRLHERTATAEPSRDKRATAITTCANEEQAYLIRDWRRKTKRDDNRAIAHASHTSTLAKCVQLRTVVFVHISSVCVTGKADGEKQRSMEAGALSLVAGLTQAVYRRPQPTVEKATASMMAPGL